MSFFQLMVATLAGVCVNQRHLNYWNFSGHLLPQKSHRGGLVHPRLASVTFGPVLLGCVSSVNVTNQWQPSTRWWRKSNFPLNGFSFIAARVSRSRNTAALHSGYQRFLKQMLQSELSKVKKKNKLAPSIGFDWFQVRRFRLHAIVVRRSEVCLLSTARTL